MALPFSTGALAAINDAAGRALGKKFRVKSCNGVSGGSIHRAYVVGDEQRSFFVKINHAAALPMFEAEIDGLHALRESGVRAPTPFACGVGGTESFLLMEHLHLREARDGDFIGLAGMLGDLHENTSPRFGWRESNFIGGTRQDNAYDNSWGEFWRTARLERQLELAAQKDESQEIASLGERVLTALPGVFDAHTVTPTLLHGDLWRGNVGFLSNGSPALFDPAVYYGDREVDIAASELFGGFPAIFYDAYFERFPTDDDYPVRRDVYNLYHLLNHVNLFNTHRRESLQTMRRLLAAIT